MVRVVIAALLLGSLPATAAEPSDAKIHFQAGRSYYDAERWEDAAREFDEAYRLSKLPELLLDLARAETHLGREESAIAHLEAYVTARPDADDVGAIRAEIAARRHALEQTRAAAAARAEAEHAKAAANEQAERARAEAARRAQAEARSAKRPTWAGILLVAAGAALVAGGITEGVLAQRDAATVSGGGSKDPDPTGSIDWVSANDGRYLEAQTNGKRNAAAGIALDVIGVAAIGGGVGVLVWALRRPRVAKRALWLWPGVGNMTVGGAF